MTNLRNLKLEQVIPQNIVQDQKVRHLAQSVDPHIQGITDWADKLNYEINLDDLPTEIIDHLLWERHMTWNEGLLLVETHEQKVELLKAAIEIHRTKGTPHAIERVVSIFFNDAYVAEWFNVKGLKTFEFAIDVKKEFSKQSDLVNVFKLVKSAKNARSQLRSITYTSDDLENNAVVELVYTENGIKVWLVIPFKCGVFYSINGGRSKRNYIGINSEKVTGRCVYKVTTKFAQTLKKLFDVSVLHRAGRGLQQAVSNNFFLGTDPYVSTCGTTQRKWLNVLDTAQTGTAAFKITTKEAINTHKKVAFGHDVAAGQGAYLICGVTRLGGGLA